MVLCSITRWEITAALQSDVTCGKTKKTLRSDILLPFLKVGVNTYLEIWNSDLSVSTSRNLNPLYGKNKGGRWIGKRMSISLTIWMMIEGL